MAGRHVALIRGINVGHAKRIAMADLRKVVEDLGYTDVRTLLNSGNVVFSVPPAVKGDPAAQFEKAVAANLGVSARVIVLTAAELAVAVDDNPLLEVAADPSRLLVAILRTAADRTKIEPLTKQEWTPDVLAMGARVAYLWCASGTLASRLAQAVGRALGDGMTTRNWNTMLKLRALAEEE